jgi:uncharacterized protein (DUF427 family)
MVEVLREEPGPGQESVWDYPRPPRIEASRRTAAVVFGGIEMARSTEALRVLETAGAPTYYLPSSDIQIDVLQRSEGPTTWCEWKGSATYFDIQVGDHVSHRAAWTYLQPKPGYERLLDHYSFYPGRVDACYLDDELVRPQPGGFYGGWVTGEIVGPIKGEPGTEWW